MRDNEFKENGYNDYNINGDYVHENKGDEKKHQRQRPSEDNRRRAPKAQKGLVTAIVVLAMLLSGTSLIALNMYGTNDYYRTQLENQYERSYYDLTSNMRDIEIKLSKVLVCNSNTQIQKNLNDITRKADSTQISISELPAAHHTINKTMRFINQLGDYSNSLANKVAEGGSLNEQNYQTLESLYKVNKEISSELSQLAARIGTELMLVGGNRVDKQPNPFAEEFGGIQENTVDYPEMVYDGPFSDGIANTELKGLKGEEVSQEAAQEKLAEYLKEFNVKDISYTGDSEGLIKSYNYNVAMENGGNMYVQMSKKGGHPVLIDSRRALEDFNFEVNECETKAEEFAKSLGFENMKSVWTSDYNGNVYINLAPVVNDVIYYSDVVKVIVARDNCDIMGLEAMSYFSNHTQRKLENPVISATEARNKLSSKIKNNIERERLVLLPRSGGKEVLAWEIAAEWNGLKYYIYIDAKTGNEIDMMRVITTEEGTVLE